MRPMCSTTRCSLSVWFFLLILMQLSSVGVVVQAQQIDVQAQQAAQAMQRAAGPPLSLTFSPVTGLATFLATAPNAVIPVGLSGQNTPEEITHAFLHAYGAAFGIANVTDTQITKVDTGDEVGMQHVRLRQMHHGVPVTAGELTVHLRGAGVVAVHAKTVSGLTTLTTTPTFSAQEAQEQAEAWLEKHLGVIDAALSPPRLEILHRGLLEDRQTPSHLAWFVEATASDVREFFWIDAQRGAMLLHFSQLTDALDRTVYTANYTSALPGTLCRSEGGPASGIPDCDFAYTYSGDTYHYYLAQHGRDSYDNAGAPLISTVQWCDPDPMVLCSLKNAFWNGSQMIYSEGFAAADDVAAHELTHAVTEHSAGLFYYMQSGALNESFSDIFGETVDLTNTGGADTPTVRWLLGEDVPGIGAIRNMMNPPQFGDPGKVSDAQFVCGTLSTDQGGVHSNSGVPNHAYALMVDGGTYNGQTITGIGLSKAGKVQYRALTQYLVSGSNFLDDYNVLQQACTDLVGTAGITTADCSEVKKALDAVEMFRTPCGRPQEPGLCPANQTLTTVFFDNLEQITSTGWTTQILTGGNHWSGGAGTAGLYWNDIFGGGSYATSGQWAFWGFDANVVGDSVVAMSQDIAAPPGVRLQFKHSYEFEADATTLYDGGVIEYSTNGGANWSDAGVFITAGATYAGALSTLTGNPLGGRNAFGRTSFGYTVTQLDVASLTNQNVRFRFRIGTDNSVAAPGWIIDDVFMYQCTQLLTVTKTGAGSGTVTSAPGGIDCGPTCTASFPQDLSVTLTATAAAGSTFTGWSGEGCSGTGSCTVSMTQARMVTATFALAQLLTVSKTGTGSGTVTSTPGGIDCGATCTANFFQGQNVTLTATVAAGSTFAGWNGEGCSGTGSCTVSMTQARTLIATFNLSKKSGGGGGCAVYPGAEFDPTMFGIMGLLGAYLVWQRNRKRLLGGRAGNRQRHRE